MPVKLVIRKDAEGKLLAEPTTKEVMMEMIAEYEGDLRKGSTERLKRKYPGRKDHIEEVRWAWVSRKEIEDLLNDNKGNGIRIYYGCHHKSTDMDPKKDYLGLHNLILVATRDEKNPDNPTADNSEDQLEESTDETKANSITITVMDDYTGMAADLLTLCPPRCP
jgi:hypothetical protein